MECSVCGLSERNVRLLDVISLKEIVKVCEACSEKEDMPILRRPTTFQLKESEKRPIIIYPREPEKNPEETKIETTLKEIADRNYERRVSQETKPRPDLVDNFHWILMRARRLKKITQEQLAEEISESTAAIKMAEKGILPEDDYRLVNKLESFLGIKIIKDRTKAKILEIQEKSPARILKFDAKMLQDLTISDLKKIKEESEKPSEDLEENQKKDAEEAEVL
ncbi:MAG TPA: hypothetical protein VMV95_03745 [Bacillota bacterium]|nr:hypothetical protein [Bacillota bacterium]